MLSRRMAWAVAIVATLTMTVSYVDRVSFSVLAPTICKALAISNAEYGWLGSAFSMAYLFGTPIAGWWIDRAGVRRGLFVSVLGWSLVAALHALTPGYAVLFLLRLGLGITEGPGFPGASQTVQRILPPGDRERGFGVLFTGSSVGAALVPLLAIWLLRTAQPFAGDNAWRFAMLGTTLVGLAWVPLWLWVTRSSEVRTRLAVIPEDKAAPRLTFMQLILEPVMLRGLAGVLASAPIFSFPAIWGAKYLVATFKLDQVMVSHYLWLPPLLFDAGAVLFGDLASRQRRPPGVPPRSLYAVGVALAASFVFLPFADGPWNAMIILAAASMGAGAMYTLTTSDLLGRVPPGSVSFAGGILAGAQSAALIVANPLIGWAVDRFGGYHEVAWSLGLWALPGGLVWLLWKPPYQEPIKMPEARVV